MYFTTIKNSNYFIDLPKNSNSVIRDLHLVQYHLTHFLRKTIVFFSPRFAFLPSGFWPVTSQSLTSTISISLVHICHRSFYHFFSNFGLLYLSRSNSSIRFLFVPHMPNPSRMILLYLNDIILYKLYESYHRILGLE